MVRGPSCKSLFHHSVKGFVSRNDSLIANRYRVLMEVKEQNLATQGGPAAAPPAAPPAAPRCAPLPWYLRFGGSVCSKIELSPRRRASDASKT